MVCQFGARQRLRRATIQGRPARISNPRAGSGTARTLTVPSMYSRDVSSTVPSASARPLLSMAEKLPLSPP